MWLDHGPTCIWLEAFISVETVLEEQINDKEENLKKGGAVIL